MGNITEDNYIEDNDLVPVILYIPNNTISLEINARIIDEDENIQTAISRWNMKELNTAKIEGDQWEVDNVKYVITDLGRKQLEKQLEEGF